jgi:hypothetical protein
MRNLCEDIHMDQFDLEKQEIAADDALKSRVSRLRDELTSSRQQIDATADLDALAALCNTAWQQIKSIDLVLHEILVHDHPSPDPLAPGPADSISELVGAALTQVTNVMTSEYDLGVAKKRLQMAGALAGHALDSLDTQIDTVVAFRSDPQRLADGDRGW